MAHVSLYRKYRPDSFAEVVGQDHVTETLARAVDGQSWHHAYLFCGPRGTGKTSSARLLAMGLNASSGPTSHPDPNDPIVVAIREGSCPDVIEIDAASNSGVDDVRDLRDKIAYSPTQGRLRIYIVDECHMLSNSAWNAFLKTIEEPPGHVVFIFATTEPHKVLPTVLSRTQRFDFRRVSDQVLTDHCKRICVAEGVTISDEALAPIVRAGDGSVRDTLSVLDQVIAFTGNAIDVEAVNRVLGTVPLDLLDQLVNAIARADVADAFGLVGQVADQGIDLRQFALDAQNHLRELLILNAAPEAGLIEGTPERLAVLKASAASTDTDRLLFAVETLNDAQVRMRAGNTRLPLEVALAKAVLNGADRARDIPRLAPALVAKPVAQPVIQAPAAQAPAAQAPAEPAPEAQAPLTQTPAAQPPATQPPQATVSDAASEPVRVPEPQPEPQPQAVAMAEAEQGVASADLAVQATEADSNPGAFDPEAMSENPAGIAPPADPVKPSAEFDEDTLPPEPEQVESLFDDMPGLEPEAIIPPASQAPEPAPALVAEPAPNAPTLADAEAAWQTVLTRIMGESKRIWSTFSQGEPAQVNGNTVVIGFRFPFHANMAAEPDAIAVASRHFTAVLGTKIKVATETNAQADAIATPPPAEVPVDDIEPEVEVEDTSNPVDEDQQFRDALALVKAELGATDTE